MKKIVKMAEALKRFMSEKTDTNLFRKPTQILAEYWKAPPSSGGTPQNHYYLATQIYRIKSP
jgi:hypothetical protein